MIDLINIGFTYPKKDRPALRAVTLGVSPGEIFTLLGPNAAGKTTLVRILSGLIIPQHGSVLIDGKDARNLKYKKGKSLGLVLGDERTFYFRLSGAQNLEFFGGLHGVRRSILLPRIQEALRCVGLIENAKLQYMRYSTGMKKRLALARALILDPDIYVLDEPNSGVDPQSARSLRETILSLRDQKKTILLTTHDMDEAERMSDRIGYLREGQLVKTGSLDEYRGLIEQKCIEIVFGQRPNSFDPELVRNTTENIRQSLPCKGIDVVKNRVQIFYNGTFDLAALLRIVADAGLEINSLNTREASLENVFIKLAGG